MKYYKEHKKWAVLKEILDEIDIPISSSGGEIWRVYLGVNIGIEIDGKGDNFERPCIIISKFNKDHIWIVPLTRSAQAIRGIHVPIRNGGLDARTVAIITQLRTVSTRRLIVKIGIVSAKEFNDIIDAIKSSLPKT